FACLVRFESSSVPTTLPTAYDVYPLDGRHDGGYYTVKDCVTIDVLPRTPGNNVYVGFMVWRSEERFSRNAETELVCRLLLEKKKSRMGNGKVADVVATHPLPTNLLKVIQAS